MDTPSYYTRQMLLQYGKQLATTRRLARMGGGPGLVTPPQQREAAHQRSLTVERVAREITDNLIFSGSDNLIVRQVLEELEQETGATHAFRFSPTGMEVHILRKTEAEGEVELVGEDKARLLATLWQVALRVVDATML